MARKARPDTVSSNGQKTELCSAQSFEKKKNLSRTHAGTEFCS